MNLASSAWLALSFMRTARTSFGPYSRGFNNDLAARVFDNVTTKLIQALDLDVSRQRLDSTHVFSHMATFGRTKLMAIAIKRFLTQLQRHDSDAYATLPEELRQRYAPPQARLLGIPAE